MIKIRKNKEIFWGIFVLWLVLPEYFGIEISSSLPLLTGSRIIIIIATIYYLRVNGFKIKLTLSKDRKLNATLFCYFTAMVFINAWNSYKTVDSLKYIFSIAMEQIILLIIVVWLIDTEYSLNRALKCLSYTSIIISIITIISFLCERNLFYFLNVVSRTMLAASTERMGVIRAEAGFGHPVYYGMYCNIMFLVSFYLFDNRIGKKKLALLSMILNIVSLVLCNSRGSLVVFLLIFLFIVCDKRKSKMTRNILIFIVALSCLGLIMFLNKGIRYFVTNITLSLLGIVNKAIVIENYGANSSGMSSRWAQFSMIWYTLKNYPFFGFGARAQTRGVLKWYWMGQWSQFNTLDMGMISTICQYGLIGEAVKLSLFYQLTKRFYLLRKNSIGKLFFVIMISYMVSLLTVSGFDALFWLVVSMGVSYININENSAMRTNGV